MTLTVQQNTIQKVSDKQAVEEGALLLNVAQVAPVEVVVGCPPEENNISNNDTNENGFEHMEDMVKEQHINYLRESATEEMDLLDDTDSSQISQLNKTNKYVLSYFRMLLIR